MLSEHLGQYIDLLCHGKFIHTQQQHPMMGHSLPVHHFTEILVLRDDDALFLLCQAHNVAIGHARVDVSDAFEIEGQ